LPFIPKPQGHHCRALGDKARSITVALGEVTVVVRRRRLPGSHATLLRDAPGCRFEQLIDLCGVDYSAYTRWWLGRGPRYAWCRTCCRSA
jgi:NADH-quinone oxidoreductase subunit C